jgi:predicted NBD/HSP70 family sugar kinase
MDKILLTAFLTALAGFITAALSIVKLVNEKESKTTDYRQAWTDSVRAALAELIAKLNAQASAVVGAKKISATHERLMREYAKAEGTEREVKKTLADFNREAFKTGLERANVLTQEVYHAYSTVSLHFKPDDLSFSRIEHKFDYCRAKLIELKEESDTQKLGAIKEQIHSATNEITNMSRGILKAEWEAVKLGEPAYKSTKKWSVWCCVVMMFLLVTIGVHAGISYMQSNSKYSVAAEGRTGK